jgi:hypothetical protein
MPAIVHFVENTSKSVRQVSRASAALLSLLSTDEIPLLDFLQPACQALKSTFSSSSAKVNFCFLVSFRFHREIPGYALEIPHIPLPGRPEIEPGYLAQTVSLRGQWKRFAASALVWIVSSRPSRNFICSDVFGSNQTPFCKLTAPDARSLRQTLTRKLDGFAGSCERNKNQSIPTSVETSVASILLLITI